MRLRQYQLDAVEAVYEHARKKASNPVVVIPTAGGKTPILATLCADTARKWGGRAIVVSHVKELLQQTCEKLHTIDPELDVGVYSAGLGRRDTEHAVLVAGIQSVYQRAYELSGDRPFNVVIVDEAHLIPRDGDGMYRQFLSDLRTCNPAVRIVGLTATPFRLDSGLIYGPDCILQEVCYEVGIRELIAQGYLCPPVSKAGAAKIDTSGVKIRGGEFVAGDLENAANKDAIVTNACAEIIGYSSDRKSVLIFASGVAHGRHVAKVIGKMGHECGFICGETPADERRNLIGRFRGTNEGLLPGVAVSRLKYLVNVNVLTTGFDAPETDCIAILRPTMSAGLWYQMVGRGFRLADEKHDFLVLDFGDNVLRHGPVDLLRERAMKIAAGKGEGKPAVKECPNCHSLCSAGYSRCPDCMWEFVHPDEPKHDETASPASVLSGDTAPARDDVLDVQDVCYSVHTKNGAPQGAPRSMRVDYVVGLGRLVSEWICVEHDGFAREKALTWWRMRSHDPMPADAEMAVRIAEAGGLAVPQQVTVRSKPGERWDRVTRHVLGPIPECFELPVEGVSNDALAELPF